MPRCDAKLVLKALGMTKLMGGSGSENRAKNRNNSRIWVKIGVSRGNARLASVFAHSVFRGVTREAEGSALFFGAFQALSNPLESKSFRVSNETRAKGDPMQAQRSGLHGEKEETRSTAEEKAAAS